MLVVDYGVDYGIGLSVGGGVWMIFVYGFVLFEVLLVVFIGLWGFY